MTNRIDEEMVCADSLVRHLKEQCDCLEVRIKREEDDPPDFWITIDGSGHAVEVTSIVMGMDDSANCKKLAKEIDQAARKQEVLRGSYVLLRRRTPALPKRNTRNWRDVVLRATEFIRETYHEASPEEACLLKDTMGSLILAKTSCRGAIVGLAEVQAKWESEVIEELHELIQTAITKKRRNMEKTFECSKVILVLYDAYGYVDIGTAQKILMGVSGYDWFHSVFWSASFANTRNELSPRDPGRIGTFLYTNEEKWKMEPMG